MAASCWQASTNGRTLVGSVKKCSWYQDFVSCLFINLINLLVIESTAVKEGPYLELWLGKRSLGAPMMSPEVKYLQPQLSPHFGVWLT